MGQDDSTRTRLAGLDDTEPSPPTPAEPTTRAPAPVQLRDPDRYDKLAEHGRGGLGRVFRAHDKELGRVVALKELITRNVSSELRTIDFWHPAVMNAAFRIPPEHSFDGTHEKVVLRRMMVERGHLRAEHAFRKKQALTDGTQFNRVLSAALGLPDRHAYGGKDAAAVAALRRTFADAGV